jgi:hypothetical protein
MQRVGYAVKRHFQQYSSYNLADSFVGEETRVSGENHRPAASPWQTLSNIVVSSTTHRAKSYQEPFLTPYC